MRSIARAVAGAAALAAITLVVGIVLLASTRRSTATVLDNKDSIAQTFSGQLVSVPATLVRYDEGTTFSPQGFFENSAIDKSARLQELAVQQAKNLKKASSPWKKTFASNQLMHFKSVHFNPLNPKGFNAKKAAVLQRLKEQAKMNREQEKKFGRPRRYHLPAYKSLQNTLSMNEFFTRSNLKETKKKSNNNAPKVEKKPKKEEETKPKEEKKKMEKKVHPYKHKRRTSGELDENDDALEADHIFVPVYPANAEYANLSQEQREAQMWGPWMRGSTSHYGRPYGIGWASSPQVLWQRREQEQEQELREEELKQPEQERSVMKAGMNRGHGINLARGQQLTRINKIDEPTTDLNPYWSPGWNYDEYSNYNPPVDGEPQMVEAGALNKKYGFATWFGPTNSYSPPQSEGRYGDGGAMDATAMGSLPSLSYGLEEYSDV